MTIKITKYRNLYSRYRELTKHTEKYRVLKTKYKLNAYTCFSISLSIICDVKMEWWILVAGEQPRGVRPWESLAHVGVRPVG
jgi:hypothetical protein